MKYNLTLLFLLMFSLTLFSQSDSTKIAFVAYWSVGDSYDYKITKVRKVWQKEILTKQDSTQYIANFKVIDSTENDYTIQWTFKNEVVRDIQNQLEWVTEDREMINSILSKSDITEVLYKTTEFGEFVEILNWQELSETLAQLLDEIMKVYQKRIPDKIDEFQNAMTPFLDVFSSKEGIEELILPELRYFHFPLGYEFDITEIIEYDQEIPDLFGGHAVKGKGVMSFKVDYDFGLCTIQEEVVIDENDAKNVIWNFLNQVNAEEEVKQEIENTVLDVRDFNYYEYYFDYGLPHVIYGGRNFLVSIDDVDFQETEELYIELIYEDDE